MTANKLLKLLIPSIILAVFSVMPVAYAERTNTNGSGGGTWGSITGTLSNQTDLNTALGAKSPIASPTFTGTATTPTLNISGLTASQLISTDGSKNLQSLTTATYPSLTELSYVKGLTSAVQTQLNGVKGSTYNYTITNDGGTYNAYSAGTLVSSNATLSTVWTAVMSDIGSNPAKITFGAGTFETTAPLTILKSNISVVGQGQGVTTIQSNSTASLDSTYFFGTDPTQSATAYSLTANATVGDLTITISSANLISSGIVAGDYIILYSSRSIDSEFNSRNQGELHKVVSVNTGTGVITIGAANNGTHVYQTMLTSDTAKVAKLTMYENISVSGITFTDTASSRPNTLGTGQVLFSFVRNLSITNNQFKGLYNAGLQVRQTWNTRIANNDFRDTKDVTPSANVFYGVVVRGAAINTTIVNNTFDNLRHGATQGAGTTTYYAGTTRDYTVSGNVSTGTFTSHFDVHQGTEGCTISNNTMVGDDGSANGIQARSPCTITGNSIIGVLGRGISLFGNASGSTVSGNDIKGATIGVVVDNGVNKVNISGNSIHDGGTGIQLVRYSATTPTVTITNASPAVFTSASHGFQVGTQVNFTTTGGLPTGLSVGTNYYVISAGLTSSTFEVSATENGSAINTSSAGSGTHSLFYRSGNDTIISGNQIFNMTTTGISADGQTRVQIQDNTFRNDVVPFIIANTDSFAANWLVSNNYSYANTTSNTPTWLGTGHTIQGNKGFGNNTSRWIQPNMTSVATTDATPVAGTAYCDLFEVNNDTLVDQIVISNGTAVSGNYRVGIYGAVTTEDTMAGAPLVYDSGDIAQSGTSTSQAHNLSSNKMLSKGRYYACLMFDNTTARFIRDGNQKQVNGWVQTYARGGGYGAFTDPAPAMTDTGSNSPAIYIRALVN